jgi:hypothetical protein
LASHQPRLPHVSVGTLRKSFLVDPSNGRWNRKACQCRQSCQR